MYAFHQWYMKNSAKGRERLGMLVRPEDLSCEEEKVIWMEFVDINEVYHLYALNTDLILTWCL